jgi:hypothetical protein
MACGHQPHCWVVLCGGINDLGNAECFKHPGDETQLISDLTVIVLWHALSSFEEILRPAPNDSNFMRGLRNDG